MDSRLQEIRRSESAAREAFEGIVPPRQLDATVQVLVDAIRWANTTKPSAWGIRINPDSVMLKVGMIEVLQLLPTCLHVVLLRAGSKEHKSESLYPSVPGSVSHDIEWTNLTAAYARVRNSHRELVGEAATTGRHPTTRATHSPGAVRYLSGQVGVTIPQPAYLLPDGGQPVSYPEEVQPDAEFQEGAVVQVLVSRRERDPKARITCLKAHGYKCAGCGRTMKERYGEAGTDIIHVHHIEPLSSSKGSRKVNAGSDLVPMCPNCHAVVHSTRPPMSIGELRNVVREFGA